jgi:hypothetical protein
MLLLVLGMGLWVLWEEGEYVESGLEIYNACGGSEYKEGGNCAGGGE